MFAKPPNLEVVVSEVEPLEMAKREKRAVGMDGTLKPFSSQERNF